MTETPEERALLQALYRRAQAELQQREFAEARSTQGNPVCLVQSGVENRGYNITYITNDCLHILHLIIYLYIYYIYLYFLFMIHIR